MSLPSHSTDALESPLVFEWGSKTNHSLGREHAVGRISAVRKTWLEPDLRHAVLIYLDNTKLVSLMGSLGLSVFKDIVKILWKHVVFNVAMTPLMLKRIQADYFVDPIWSRVKERCRIYASSILSLDIVESLPFLSAFTGLLGLSNTCPNLSRLEGWRFEVDFKRKPENPRTLCGIVVVRGGVKMKIDQSSSRSTLIDHDALQESWPPTMFWPSNWEFKTRNDLEIVIVGNAENYLKNIELLKLPAWKLSITATNIHDIERILEIRPTKQPVPSTGELRLASVLPVRHYYRLNFMFHCINARTALELFLSDGGCTSLLWLRNQSWPHNLRSFSLLSHDAIYGAPKSEMKWFPQKLCRLEFFNWISVENRRLGGPPDYDSQNLLAPLQDSAKPTMGDVANFVHCLGGSACDATYIWGRWGSEIPYGVDLQARRTFTGPFTTMSAHPEPQEFKQETSVLQCVKLRTRPLPTSWCQELDQSGKMMVRVQPTPSSERIVSDAFAMQWYGSDGSQMTSPSSDGGLSELSFSSNSDESSLSPTLEFIHSDEDELDAMEAEVQSLESSEDDRFEYDFVEILEEGSS